MNISKCCFGDYCKCDDLTSCGGVSEDGQLCSGLCELLASIMCVTKIGMQGSSCMHMHIYIMWIVILNPCITCMYYMCTAYIYTRIYMYVYYLCCVYAYIHVRTCTICVYMCCVLQGEERATAAQTPVTVLKGPLCLAGFSLEKNVNATRTCATMTFTPV